MKLQHFLSDFRDAEKDIEGNNYRKLKEDIRLIRNAEIHALKTHANWKEKDIAKLFKVSVGVINTKGYSTRRRIDRYNQQKKSKNEIQYMV